MKEQCDCTSLLKFLKTSTSNRKLKEKFATCLWFYLPYITGLKEGSRHYDIRSFNGVLPFIERIKKWVDVKKTEEDYF